MWLWSAFQKGSMAVQTDTMLSDNNSIPEWQDNDSKGSSVIKQLSICL
jgi:hypothetical protein